MLTFVVIALVVSHSLVLLAGGYLHYRYGKTVVTAAEALKNLPH